MLSPVLWAIALLWHRMQHQWLQLLREFLQLALHEAQQLGLGHELLGLYNPITVSDHHLLRL
ncbi:MAG: hypothetical protein WBV06_16455 [Acidimicrobiia bacterium]